MTVAESPVAAPKSANDMAVMRTVMAADRTLMAWVRTALSMIGFGFTIYKVLQAVQAENPQLMPIPHTPRKVGLFLIGLGTMAVAVGTIEYWQTLRELSRQERLHVLRPSLVIAAIIAAGGVLLFTSIATRWF